MAYLSNVNAIPEMTSDTAPSGGASASSTQNQAWIAFSNANDWRTANGQTAGWIRYDFTRKIVISKYSIKPYTSTGGASANPKDWTFEGSNDNTNWVILDSQTNQTGWGSSEREYIFSNSKEYEKYRLNFSSNNGHATWTGINRLMMFEYFYDQKILLLNEHKLKSIVEYNYSESLIPDMTVYSNAIGTIRASTEGGSGYEAWRAFTDSNQNWGSSTTGYPQWIGFTFNDLTKVNKYEVTNGNGTLSTRYPTSWTFEGSLDNLEWTVLDSRKGESWTGEKTAREFEFINSKAFKIYRLNISSGNNTISIGINRIKMFYKPQPTLITINKMSPTENEFLSYGMESSNVKTLISFDTVRSIELETSQFGSGKVFEHSVDLSKRRTKKILLL